MAVAGGSLGQGSGRDAVPAEMALAISNACKPSKIQQRHGGFWIILLLLIQECFAQIRPSGLGNTPRSPVLLSNACSRCC